MKVPESINVVLCGAGGVGKTALVNRYLTNSFNPEQVMTVGLTYAARDLTFSTWRVELQVWDFGGQVEFRSPLRNYLAGMAGALLLFDLASFSSLLGLDQWVEMLRDSAPAAIPVLLVGCKDDLCETDQRQESISEYIIRDYVRANYLLDFVRTSAASGKNVDACFNRLVWGIIAQTLLQGGASLE